VRDSAGVRVVASAAPAWGEGKGWRLSPEPVLRVGVAEGDAAYQFGSVAGAVRLADGGIAAADRQSGDVRWYDARGRHVRTVGRKGGGPASSPASAGSRRSATRWRWGTGARRG
jgi:hypothetical protein